MKNSSFIIIILALALVLITYRRATSTVETENTATMQTSAIENIMTRTSVRAYTDQPIEKETVDTLLRAAMAAPTAGNKQPWRFVVVDDRKLLDYIGEHNPTMTMAKHAPLAVVMCGDPDATFPGEGRDYWVQDVSAATENLLLAAHALGLGAVWCGIYPMSERVADFSQLLKLPDNIVPMACVVIGYPSASPTPKDKWNPDNVRYNSWQ